MQTAARYYSKGFASTRLEYLYTRLQVQSLKKEYGLVPQILIESIQEAGARSSNPS